MKITILLLFPMQGYYNPGSIADQVSKYDWGGDVLIEVPTLQTFNNYSKINNTTLEAHMVIGFPENIGAVAGMQISLVNSAHKSLLIFVEEGHSQKEEGFALSAIQEASKSNPNFKTIKYKTFEDVIGFIKKHVPKPSIGM